MVYEKVRVRPPTIQPYRAEPKAGEAGPKAGTLWGVARVTRFGLEPAPCNWFPRGSVWGSFRPHSRHQPCRDIKLGGAYVWGLNPSRSSPRRLYREEVYIAKRVYSEQKRFSVYRRAETIRNVSYHLSDDSALCFL